MAQIQANFTAEIERQKTQNLNSNFSFWFCSYTDYLNNRYSSHWSPTLHRITFNAGTHEIALQMARAYAIRNKYALFIQSISEKELRK